MELELESQGAKGTFKARPYETSMEDFLAWWMSRSIDCDLIAAANAGRKLDSQCAKVLAHRANFGIQSHARAIERQKIDPTTGLSKAIWDERNTRQTRLSKAVKSLMDPAVGKDLGGLVNKKTKGHSRVNWFHHGICPACHQIVVGRDRNSRHFCSDGSNFTLNQERLEDGME